MDIMNEIFDFTEGLDFWTKYGLIMSNFAVILIILIFKRKQIQSIEKKNILIVTAHPDDESMFFLPTILELRKSYNMHLLCLSNGNFDNLGKIREKELEKCCQYLKIQNILIINDVKLPDGMKNSWSSEIIYEYVKKYIKEKQIHCVITFDEYGISGHINHVSVFKGVQKLKQEIQNNEQPEENKKNEDDKSLNLKAIKFYSLESVSIFRKYIGITDFFLTGFHSSKDFLYINYNFLVAWKSMQIHYSQFVWYRKLFVIFSRYAYLNLLKEIQ